MNRANSETLAPASDPAWPPSASSALSQGSDTSLDTIWLTAMVQTGPSLKGTELGQVIIPAAIRPPRCQLCSESRACADGVRA